MNLFSKFFGGADQAYKAVITKPAITSTVAAGFSFEDGEGTELPLHIGPNGFGPKNGAGKVSHITTLATVDRAVSLADAPGTVSPELVAVLASDVTNSTTTGLAISSFGFPIEASATYKIDIVLRVQSASVNTGYQFQITGPTSQISFAVYEVEYMTTDTLTVSNVKRQTIRAIATNVVGIEAPAANLDYFVRVRGILKTTGTTPVGDIGITFQSEVASSQVTTKEGSVIIFKKIKQL